MAIARPDWLSVNAVDPSTPADFDTYAALGRLLLTQSARHAGPRMEARANLAERLREHGVAPVARGWEGCFSLAKALLARAANRHAPPDRRAVLAFLQARHTLHAARIVLLRAELLSPPLADAVLARAARIAASLDDALATLDESAAPWLPRWRSAIVAPSTDLYESRWLAELVDARAPGANPWWIDVADPRLVARPVRPTAIAGLGAAEPARLDARWRFERGWRVTVSSDPSGSLVASLESAPDDLDRAGLSLVWLDGDVTRSAPFQRGSRGELRALPDAAALTSEVVALRDGDRFIHRRESGDA